MISCSLVLCQLSVATCTQCIDNQHSIHPGQFKSVWADGQVNCYSVLWYRCSLSDTWNFKVYYTVKYKQRMMPAWWSVVNLEGVPWFLNQVKSGCLWSWTFYLYSIWLTVTCGHVKLYLTTTRVSNMQTFDENMQVWAYDPDSSHNDCHWSQHWSAIKD